MALVPFHAFLTVWASSFAGHYTLIRLWKEFLLAILVLGAVYLLVEDKNLFRRIWRTGLFRLILIYSAVIIIWGLLALATHNVTGKAMWYGILIDLRFLIFFCALMIISAKSGWLAANWQNILLVPAMIVAAFAVLQYLILPYDFLKHFGYGDSTITPYETINHNLNHIRAASTLRGANPLGAYLLLPISALAVLILREKRERRDKLMISFGMWLALAFSFSRSAWLGALASIIAIAWLSIRNGRAKKLVLLAVAGLLVLAGISLLALRNNTTFENYVYHTDHTSKIAESSNEGHSAAFKAAWHDISHQPLGRGTGTAGPASTYNYGHYGRISENYFMQIGQETGWIGMLLFIGICVTIARELWLRRADNLALILLASFIGITFINLLSHAWTDDTLAYLWWGLAAVALAPPRPAQRRSR